MKKAIVLLMFFGLFSCTEQNETFQQLQEIESVQVELSDYPSLKSNGYKWDYTFEGEMPDIMLQFKSTEGMKDSWSYLNPESPTLFFEIGPDWNEGKNELFVYDNDMDYDYTETDPQERAKNNEVIDVFEFNIEGSPDFIEVYSEEYEMKAKIIFLYK